MGVVTQAAATGVAQPHFSVFGDRKVRWRYISPSSTYATGGETVTFPDFKVTVDFVHIEDLNVDATHVYTMIYDRTNGKLKIINLIGGAEVLNNVDLSALAFRAMIVGK